MKNIFKRHDIGIDTKVRLLNSCVVPVMTYGAESWTMTKEMERKVDAQQIRWLRRIMGINYRDHKTNEEVRERTKQVELSNQIRNMRMKWLGHLTRMDNKRITKRIHKWKPKGKRAIGRPRKRWMDNLNEDMKRAGLAINGKTTGRNRMTLEELTEDRRTWRTMVAASMSESRWTMIT